jgi:RNA-directed DNA polymerase
MQLRRREAGWRAAGSELAVRRKTNSIRRDVATSLLIHGEVRNTPGTLSLVAKAMLGRITWLEAERWESATRQAGRPVAEVTAAGVRVCVVPQGSEVGQGDAEGNRSPSAGEQTLPNARTGRWKSTESKAAPREGRQEGGNVKDRTSDSESEVMTVPEEAKQITSEATGKRAWIDREIWTERMLAALDNGVKGNKWFSLIDKVYRPQTLMAAWQQVRANKGAAGIDGQSCERFAADAERYLNELAEELKEGRYRPAPVRRVEIAKTDGKKRPLGIPTVKDRIAQTAVKRVIEPIFEQAFLSTSFGFRPGRSCKDALREVDNLLKKGNTHVVDADLKGYFDSIPHDRLQARIEERISDSRLLALLASWLKQDIVHGLERWAPTGGTPQGAVISPLLANLYLHPLDERMVQQGYAMVRYADDFVILCPTAEKAEQALDEIKAWVEANGLILHPDKTHVGDCRREGQGFDFLGYRFEAGKRWVRKKSLMALKDKIRTLTQRTRGDSLARIIADLNPRLKGWFGYFKHAQALEFRRLDGFIRRRLRALLRKQEKRPGIGRCLTDHSRWPNAYFAATGLFTMTEAWLLASQSR